MLNLLITIENSIQYIRNYKTINKMRINLMQKALMRHYINIRCYAFYKLLIGLLLHDSISRGLIFNTRVKLTFTRNIITLL